MPALQWIGYLSTVGVYGNHDGAWVDETAQCRPVSKRSVMRVKAETDWLRLGRTLAGRWRSCACRASTARAETRWSMWKTARRRRLVKPGQVFNRIHCDDIAGALWQLISGNTGGIFKRHR